MIEGVCIDAKATTVLTEGESYFLFPNGKSHYYVSKFPNPKAHKGCYQADMFRAKEKEVFDFDRDKIYTADLVHNGNYTTELRQYYIQPKKTHCFFYKDFELTECRGSFPLSWFTNFKEAVEEPLLDTDDNGQFLLF